MFKKILLFALPVILPLLLTAQDKIETDRPTETQNAGLMPTGKLQGEIGFRKEQQQAGEYSYQHPNAVFRYGLFKVLELRLVTAFETEKEGTPKVTNHGLQPVEAGIKARLYQSKDTSFIVSLYGHLGLPHFASKNYELDKAFYRARLLLQNKLTEKIKVNYNVGREWDSRNIEQTWMYSISPQIELSDKWQLLLEEYATFQQSGAPEHYLDAGVAFGFTNNLQLDINAGKGLNPAAADYFIDAGVSFRL